MEGRFVMTERGLESAEVVTHKTSNPDKLEEAITHMSAIEQQLELLRQDIQGGAPKQQDSPSTSFGSLALLLSDGPQVLARIREQCLAQINDIRDILF
jgi:hypothetical protein